MLKTDICLDIIKRNILLFSLDIFNSYLENIFVGKIFKDIILFKYLELMFLSSIFRSFITDIAKFNILIRKVGEVQTHINRLNNKIQ